MAHDLEITNAVHLRSSSHVPPNIFDDSRRMYAHINLAWSQCNIKSANTIQKYFRIWRQPFRVWTLVTCASIPMDVYTAPSEEMNTETLRTHEYHVQRFTRSFFYTTGFAMFVSRAVGHLLQVTLLPWHPQVLIILYQDAAPRSGLGGGRNAVPEVLHQLTAYMPPLEMTAMAILASRWNNNPGNVHLTMKISKFFWSFNITAAHCLHLSRVRHGLQRLSRVETNEAHDAMHVH